MFAKIPRPVALLGVSVLLTGMTACSGEEAKPETSTPSAPATTTVPATTQKQEPAATVTVTQQQTQTQAPEPKPAENAFPAGQQVASADFQLAPDSHYWSSPTGRIYCGVIPGAEQIMAGCQMASALPECGPDHNVSAPLVHFADRAALTRTCTTQGIYVNANSKVLEYGKQLDIGPFTAVSKEDGMYMMHRQTGEAFSIAVEGIRTFNVPV